MRVSPEKYWKDIIVYCDKLIISLLVAVVIIVPLFFDVRLYSVFDLSKVTTLYLLAIVILAAWSVILVFKDNFKFSPTSLDIPILAYLFVFILSSILSINPLVSFFGAYKRFEGLTATVCYVFLFYTTVNFVSTRKRLSLLIISIITGAIVSSCYGIAQHLGFDMFKWSSFEARRVFSTFGNPVFFSAYLVMILPLAVVLFFKSPSDEEELPVVKKRYMVWIFFLFSLIIYTTFWLTNTRACFVALLGGLTPFLFLIYKRQFTQRYKFITLITLFILIGVMFNVRHETSVVKHFTADMNTFEFPAKEESDAVSIFDEAQPHKRPWIATKLSVTGSTFSRVFQYMAAIKIIEDYPILGIGPDTIGIVYQSNLAKVFSLQVSDNGFPFPRQDRIHNDILDTTVTRGIVGLGTYLWLLAAFGISIGKNYKKLQKRDKLLILGLLAGILCYLIQNEFSFGNTPIVTLFWIMMGLCISIIKMNEDKRCLAATENTGNEAPEGQADEKFQTSRFSKPYKWLCCGIVLLTIGFVFISLLRVYRADAYFEFGRRVLAHKNRGDSGVKMEKGLYLITQAIFLNPYEVFYQDELCRAYIQMALKTRNEAWMQKIYEGVHNSLQLIPQHYLGFFHLGVIYQILFESFDRDTIDKAIASYKKAIEMDTFQAPFHSNLASLYAAKGDMDSAIKEFSQAYMIRPAEISYSERLSNAFLQKGDLDRAILFSNKTIELNPAEPGYYNKSGFLLNKKGMHEEAIRAFKKAIEIDPKEPVYTHNLAGTLITQGRYTDAQQIIESFNTAYPDHRYVNIRLLLADIYFKNNNWEKTASECEQIITTIDPTSMPAYKMLITSYCNMHQYGLAKKMLDQVLILNPNDQEMKDLLTNITLKINKDL